MLTTPGIPLDQIIEHLADKDLMNFHESGNAEIRDEIRRVSELRVKQHPEFHKMVSLEGLHKKILAAVAARETNVILPELTPMQVIAIDLAKSGQTFSLAYLVSNYLHKNFACTASRECFKLTQIQQDHVLIETFKVALSNGHAFTCAELFAFMDIMGIDSIWLDRFFPLITGRGWTSAVKWMLCTFYRGNESIVIVPRQVEEWAIEWDLNFLDWMYDTGFFRHQSIPVFFETLDEMKLHRDIRAGDLTLLKWFVEKIGGEKEFAKIPELKQMVINHHILDAESYHRDSVVVYLKTLIA